MIRAYLMCWRYGYYRLCVHRSHRLHLPCFRLVTSDGKCSKHNGTCFHQCLPRPTATLTVRVRDDGPDGLSAEVVELPGCFASGFTEDELYECLLEGISLYLTPPGHRRAKVRRDDIHLIRLDATGGAS